MDYSRRAISRSAPACIHARFGHAQGRRDHGLVSRLHGLARAQPAISIAGSVGLRFVHAIAPKRRGARAWREGVAEFLFDAGGTTRAGPGISRGRSGVRPAPGRHRQPWILEGTAEWGRRRHRIETESRWRALHDRWRSSRKFPFHAGGGSEHLDPSRPPTRRPCPRAGPPPSTHWGP